MANVALKLRYISHPYIIWRAIIGRYEWRFSKRTRVDEYEKYAYSMENGLRRLLDVNANRIRDFKAQFGSRVGFHEKMNEAKKFLGSLGGGMGEGACTLLYVICRILQPRIIVETGVASGFSSASILQALEDNGVGELYSIDLHYRDGVTIPVDKELGWVVPVHLKRRWHLMLGEGFKVLPLLLKELGTIDIFLHDSRHTYKTMMKEYSIAWPRLREGGLLLSDDVIENDAFIDFADKVKLSPVVVGRMGAIRKITVDVDNSKNQAF